MKDFIETTRKLIEVFRNLRPEDSNQILELQKATEEASRALANCENPIEIETALLQDGALLWLDPKFARLGWEKVLAMGRRTPAGLRGFADHLEFYYDFDDENLRDALREEANKIEQSGAE